MTVTSQTKFHVSIAVNANEVIDTEYFAPETGQTKLRPSLYEGIGALEVSANETDWIQIGASENTLLNDSAVLPRFIRCTSSGVIHFVSGLFE